MRCTVITVPSEPVPRVASGEPALTPAEERAWRSLVRLMVLLPRAIDEDLTRRDGLGLTRYVVLMRLSEAPQRTLRMSDLAESASISPSRLTRIVQAMTADGLITREEAPGDARACLATLTAAGLERLQAAWPAHLAGVRALVLDHLEPRDLAGLHRATERLLRVVEGTTGTCRGSTPTPLQHPCSDRGRSAPSTSEEIT